MKLSLTKKIFAVTLISLLLLIVVATPMFSVSAEGTSSEISEIRYGLEDSPIISSYATETVNFTKRETNYYEVKNGVPLYQGLLSNSCGATAGAIIVGFYDKYFEELIPNYTSYLTNGNYKGNDSTNVPQLMQELYDLMRTNVDDVGVSEADCLDGLKTYVQNKNRNIKYTSIKSSPNVNSATYLYAMNSNIPVIVFGSNVIIQTFNTGSTSENIFNNTISNNHIFVGYGYYVVKYYSGSNNFRTDTYMRVACGRTDFPFGFIRLASSSASAYIQTGWLNNAYTVAIF